MKKHESLTLDKSLWPVCCVTNQSCYLVTEGYTRGCILGISLSPALNVTRLFPTLGRLIDTKCLTVELIYFLDYSVKKLSIGPATLGCIRHPMQEKNLMSALIVKRDYLDCTTWRNTKCFTLEKKPFACGQCEKSFVVAKHLEIHQRSHTGEKPFACSQCEKHFTQHGNLKVHQRHHTQEKPYICLLCGKSFTQSGNLAKHKQSHMGKNLGGLWYALLNFLCQINLTCLILICFFKHSCLLSINKLIRSQKYYPLLLTPLQSRKRSRFLWEPGGGSLRRWSGLFLG